MRIKGSACALAALLAVAAHGVGAAASPVAPPTCGKLLAPTSGIYFGANPDFVSNPRRLEGDSVTTEAIDEYARLAGRRPVLTSFVQHWFLGLEFPREKVLTV